MIVTLQLFCIILDIQLFLNIYRVIHDSVQSGELYEP